MSKYSDISMTVGELADLTSLADILNGLGYENIALDHVQIGDVNGEILGKMQYENGYWTFRPRKHDKPGVLGE